MGYYDAERIGKKIHNRSITAVNKSLMYFIRSSVEYTIDQAPRHNPHPIFILNFAVVDKCSQRKKGQYGIDNRMDQFIHGPNFQRRE